MCLTLESVIRKRKGQIIFPRNRTRFILVVTSANSTQNLLVSGNILPFILFILLRREIISLPVIFVTWRQAYRVWVQACVFYCPNMNHEENIIFCSLDSLMSCLLMPILLLIIYKKNAREGKYLFRMISF